METNNNAIPISVNQELCKYVVNISRLKHFIIILET